MGDKARFEIVANLFSKKFPDRNRRIADIAGGKGQLRVALNVLGYKKVITFDPMDRVKKAKGKHLLQYFDYKTDSTKFDLVVAVHPDGATDHAILSDLPGIIVPCCPIPSAVKWEFKKDGWIKHLKSLTSRTVTEKQLPFRGANIALIIR